MSRPLRVVIVGAGLAGLSAAVAVSLAFTSTTNPTVVVVEAAKELEEIGAGIQIAPNMTRLLHGLGIAEQLGHYATLPQIARQVRWKNAEELTRFAINENDRMEGLFGYKYYHIHRADLQHMLVQRGCELGVQIVKDCRIVAYRHNDAQGAEYPEEVVAFDGRRFEADVVIAADGARSTMCEAVAGRRVVAQPTGDCAYRAILTREQASNPAFESLRLELGQVTWLGPQRHVVGYYVRGGRYYNLVILAPEEEANEETWKLPGDLEKLRKWFEDWDPRLQKLLEMVESSYVWSLRHRPQLDSWVHPDGNLVLLGDSAHPMLPYVGQGAAAAVEDGIALAECLQHAVQNGWPLRDALSVYQGLRKTRTDKLCDAGEKNRNYFHLEDGPEQIARDEALARGYGHGATPNQLNDMKKLQEMYGYDVRDETQRALKNFKSVCTDAKCAQN